MEVFFADSNYWIALFDSDDLLHRKVMEITENFPAFTRMVTSDLVILEVLNSLGVDTREVKQNAVHFFDSAHASLRVIPWSRELFDRAKTLYLRADKEWSIVDCTSFVIMRDEAIRAALTYDRHLGQAGFRVLLRDDE